MFWDVQLAYGLHYKTRRTSRDCGVDGASRKADFP